MEICATLKTSIDTPGWMALKEALADPVRVQNANTLTWAGFVPSLFGASLGIQTEQWIWI